MFEKMKGNILFHQLLKRPDIQKAYAMVEPTDSWYDTITKVHDSLAEIQKRPHEVLELHSHDGLRLKGVYYPNENGMYKQTELYQQAIRDFIHIVF